MTHGYADGMKQKDRPFIPLLLFGMKYRLSPRGSFSGRLFSSQA